MTTERVVAAKKDGQAVSDSPSPSRVVVGVDGTAANDIAVTWAAREARRHGCPLVLLGAGSGDTPSSAPRSENLEREHIQRLTRDMLEAVRDRLLHKGLDVRVEVGIGEPSHALIRFTDEHDLVVVGKRDGHPMSRTVLGSTSIATVGRASGAVVVVPEHWSAEEHDDEPIVVGLRELTDEAVLREAFKRAADLSVDLMVVRSWEMPTAFGRSPEDVVERGTKEQDTLESCLNPWRRHFPDVSTQTRCAPLAPAVALLGDASGAQLMVLGRHTRASHPGGLSLESTTRRVLHHARCPVLVVPETAAAARDDAIDETDAPEY